MKKYIETKVISAEPANGPMGLCGYTVKSADRHETWVSDEDFESTCHAIDDGMTFGDALYFLKRGKKVTRKGWNGKGMYLWIAPSYTLSSDILEECEIKECADANGGEILCLGAICMYTHDSTGRNAILTGWLASQSDMLSEDWVIVR